MRECMKNYYYLKKGEIIMEGDEVDICIDGWRDTPKWVKVTTSIGQSAPDPQYVSHRRYRRRIYNIDIREDLYTD